jgi:hypothetical protein
MRIVYTALLAAALAAGPVTAFAQGTGAAPAAPAKTAKTAAPKPKACKGRAEADCAAPDCQWIAASTKAGKPVKAYCRKPAAPKKPS